MIAVASRSIRASFATMLIVLFTQFHAPAQDSARLKILGANLQGLLAANRVYANHANTSGVEDGTPGSTTWTTTATG